jgi:chromosomal replication initiation ATPase DnaA
MNYSPAQQINTARNIARTAQHRIKQETGMEITLMVYPPGKSAKTPRQMLNVIAQALGMSPQCYCLKTRLHNIAELRHIGAFFLRMYYPSFTLTQIAAIYGQDHSSVINGISRAHNLIYTKDPEFTRKYNIVLKSINQWLGKEE